MTTNEHYVKFLFELGMLKRVQREGWKLLGITQPEHVASHSLRAAQIGYILAHLEQYEHPEMICTILVFHDIGECRIGDIHKVGNRYIQQNERQAVHDQTQPLGAIGKKIYSLFNQIDQLTTIEGIIAKDADLLEMVVTACELKHMNIKGTDSWIKNTRNQLKTDTAKRLVEHILSTDPTDWWKELKKIPYK